MEISKKQFEEKSDADGKKTGKNIEPTVFERLAVHSREQLRMEVVAKKSAKGILFT